MPALTDLKLELFSIQVAGGASKTEAAKRAGYGLAGANNTGSRLYKRPDVLQRVTELRAASQPDSIPATADARALNFVAKPWIIQELVSTHRLASAAKDFSVSVQCLRTLAQLGGHLSDGNKQVTPGPRTVTQINVLNPSQLNEALRHHIGSIPSVHMGKMLNEAPELAELIEQPLEQPTANPE